MGLTNPAMDLASIAVLQILTSASED